MNARHPDPDDTRLSDVLHSWDVPDRLSPRFTEGVWRRIESRSGATSKSPLATLATFATWLSEVLRQRRVAAAYLLLLVTVGASAGTLRGHASSERLSLALQNRYVQSIDPFAEHLH